MSSGNVPADLTVTSDLVASAMGFMTLAAGILGPLPADPEGRRRYGYRLAHTAADLATTFDRPLAGLTKFLAQVRASEEKAPLKGILRNVEQVERGTNKAGSPLYKVKLTVEATSSGGKHSQVGDTEVLFSDFTHAVGFGDFEGRVRALIGQECLFYKYLEDTEGRGQGETANVVVRVVPIRAQVAPAQGQPAAAAATPPAAQAPPAEPAQAPAAAATPPAAQAPGRSQPVDSKSALAAARAEKPGTKSEIVAAIVKHFGLDASQAAETCRRVAGTLTVDIGAPSPADIERMWKRMCNEQARALAAHASAA